MNCISLLGLDAWIARIRASVIETAIAAEDRADLAQLEWQDFKRRLVTLAIMAIALGVLTVVVLIMGSVALLVSYWDTEHRTMVAWLLGGGWFALWLVLIFCLMSVAKRLANPFGLTRSELLADWQSLKKRL